MRVVMVCVLAIAGAALFGVAVARLMTPKPGPLVVMHVSPPRTGCTTDIPPLDPTPLRPAEVVTQDWTIIARVGVLGDPTTGREALVRTVAGGWCMLVPAGAKLTFAVDRAWIWFARYEDDVSAVWLSRVPVDGGALQRIKKLARLPDKISLAEGLVRADEQIIGDTSMMLPDVPADAGAILAVPAMPWHPQHPPEAVNNIVKIPIGDYMLQDEIVRTTKHGPCVLVPPGPAVTMQYVRGWVYFTRAEAVGKFALFRVDANGGEPERLASLPFEPNKLTFRWGDLFASDGQREWPYLVSEDWPTGRATCPD